MKPYIKEALRLKDQGISYSKVKEILTPNYPELSELGTSAFNSQLIRAREKMDAIAHTFPLPSTKTDRLPGKPSTDDYCLQVMGFPIPDEQKLSMIKTLLGVR